ncbi:TrmB family transcriptional regulator [Pendulispora brunnea]|uniref:TrmB family transcriptional regulator n=1 Tax=Pendulispora brunnea TaxID=2905690 RepID=A0ABZ2K5B7_9BACT
MTRELCIEALVDLGFTALEAEVYVTLVEHSPATAYKVAQEVGKAAANVYKAVESLQRKGAILVEESSGRLCRAVPPAELIGQLQQQFAQARTRAEQALAKLRGPAPDERVYQLAAHDQVLARARAMIERGQKVLLCDLFPESVELLRGDLEKAARRGVSVCVQTYAPATFPPGIHVFENPAGARQLEAWPGGQWLNIVADAREYLFALLRTGGEGVHQAVWSESPCLSVVHHSGIKSEMTVVGFQRLIEAKADAAAFAQAFARTQQLFGAVDLPGYAALRERLGPA